MAYRVLRLTVIVIMNLWGYSLLIVWTLLGSILAFPGFIIWRLLFQWPFSKIMRHFVWIYGRGSVYIFRPFISIKHNNWHREMLPCPGIVVINHCSFFDTYLLGMLPAYDGHICIKSWPFKMFWYTFFMRLAGYFDWERSDWEEILAGSKQVINNGRYLVVFPEGHRSKSGKLGRFHFGAFKLSILLNVPIIPLCIVGTHTLLPPGRLWFRPAGIQMRLLPPVYPNEGVTEGTHRNFCKQVRKQMDDVIEKMNNNVEIANA